MLDKLSAMMRRISQSINEIIQNYLRADAFLDLRALLRDFFATFTFFVALPLALRANPAAKPVDLKKHLLASSFVLFH